MKFFSVHTADSEGQAVFTAVEGMPRAHFSQYVGAGPGVALYAEGTPIIALDGSSVTIKGVTFLDGTSDPNGEIVATGRGVTWSTSKGSGNAPVPPGAAIGFAAAV